MNELWKKLKKQFKMSDLTTQTFYDFFKEYENKRISEFLKELKQAYNKPMAYYHIGKLIEKWEKGL